MSVFLWLGMTNIYTVSVAPMGSALGSVVNAEPESARWLPIGSRYVASSPANSLALNESVQCIRLLDRMSRYNVAYLCGVQSQLHMGCVFSHGKHKKNSPWNMFMWKK